ncbi:MAG: radical SAM family heme chaperone HemW [Saprospiraceae bacterium]|nr:radical SAM family heme chaperone HemW [Saprospiraceae bacterium]
MKEIGIYIHIPYCKRKCSYCNFHFSTNISTKDQLIEALIKEIRIRATEAKDMQLTTLYFGGGTPSLFSIEELKKVIEEIQANYNFNGLLEFTIEVNPDDISEAYARSLKSIGINRVSVGLQSFIDQELVFMDRVHDAAQSFKAVNILQDVGFEKLTVDLIYGLPNSSEESWLFNLNELLKLNVSHFSAYLLSIEPKTKLFSDLAKNKVFLIDDDLAMRQMDCLLEFCNDNEYEAYEVSNFAKKGHRAIHNSNYWNRVPYIGFGPSAHSFAGNQRRWNIANNNVYIKALENNDVYWDFEILSEKNIFNEFIYLNLRKIEGISRTLIQALYPQYVIETLNDLDQLVLDGLMVVINDSYVLTAAGRKVSDRIASDLFKV